MSSSLPAPIPKFYTHHESGNCYKVRLLSALLNIQLEEIEVDLFAGENKTKQFREISPRGTVPVLHHGDKVLTDSAGILVYLAGSCVGSKNLGTFWSSEVEEQARIVDWFVYAATWITNGVSLSRNIVNFNRKASLEEAHAKANASLDILEDQLKKGDWLVSGRPTLADLACFPYVALAPMGNVKLDGHPAVVAWIARIKDLPGFISMPGLDDPLYRQGRKQALPDQPLGRFAE